VSAWDYSLHPTRKNLPKSHIIFQPSLFGRDGWILALFFFCMCMDLDSSLRGRCRRGGMGKKPVCEVCEYEGR